MGEPEARPFSFNIVRAVSPLRDLQVRLAGRENLHGAGFEPGDFGLCNELRRYAARGKSSDFHFSTVL